MISKLSKIFVLSLVASVFAGASSAQVTMNNLDQNADQSMGQYMPMNMNYAGFSSLGMTQAAWLDPLQNLGEGQSRPAYSKYYWSPDLVLPVRLREGMITLINFPDWELIEDMYIGDNATFDGQISGPNTILLYPRKGANVGVDTNIILFGRSGNRYVFYAKSEGVNTERLTNSIIDIDVVEGANGGSYSGGGSGNRSFSGGIGKGRGSSGYSAASSYTKRNQRNNWIEDIPVDPSKFRFDIEIYVPNPDDVVIAPERVWRDDIFTYIDLGEKALNMTQRPIVTMIVERSEVPVGFRTKGPNNRLIIVEGVGDMVLRNGKRIVCLKLRRSDDAGMENVSYADDLFSNEWYVQAPVPGRNSAEIGDGNVLQGFGPKYPEYSGGMPGNYGYPPAGMGGSGAMSGGMNPSGMNGAGSEFGNGYDGFDYSQMQHISNTENYPSNSNAIREAMGYGKGMNGAGSGDISIELGVDAQVSNLEALWSDLSKKYPDMLSQYEPYYSVDTPADGHGKELFHLRIGAINNLEDGDVICNQLGRNGVFCSVVRTQ